MVTGLIKANFPARIAFQVSSKIDSRTILDANGAEALLGLGDMLYLAPGGRLIRLHGSYVSDDEVLRVVQHVKAEAGPDYCEETVLHDSVNVEDEQERDEVYEQAREIVLSSGQALGLTDPTSVAGGLSPGRSNGRTDGRRRFGEYARTRRPP